MKSILFILALSCLFIGVNASCNQPQDRNGGATAANHTEKQPFVIQLENTTVQNKVTSDWKFVKKRGGRRHKLYQQSLNWLSSFTAETLAKARMYRITSQIKHTT